MRPLVVGAVSVLLAGAVQAQTPPTQATPPATRTGKATITGVAVDSLNGDYLVGAEVVIEGARLNLTTDSFGRFRADSLAPGTYQVGIFHPLLDTLGLSLATQPFHVGPDSVSVVTLSVPSAETIISRSCEVRPRAQGRSAIIGHVVDPETLQPVAGADVSVAWVEIEVSKEIGIRESPRVIRDSTDSSGRYNLCGLPNEMEATLQAKRGNSVTAQIPIELGEAPVELFARTLLLAPVDSGAKTGKAVLRGRVILEGSGSGAGTRVEVAGTDAVGTTDAKGEFTLSKLPSGTHILVARHIGYAANAVAVDLSSRETKSVTVRLPKFINVMDPVVVNARRNAALDRVGFARRQRSGMGHYITPEQIGRMKPIRITDVLRQVPGLRVNYSPEGETVTSSRGAGSGSCVVYFVDEMRWTSVTPGDINSFVGGNEVVAVEVYHGTAPAQYMVGTGNCTTIVLWTRMKIRD